MHDLFVGVMHMSLIANILYPVDFSPSCIALVAGIMGAVAGTFGGAKARSLLARKFGRDLPAALLEDAVAFGIAAFALFR